MFPPPPSDALSPASSADDSGPESPYTPASTSFPPSVFSSSSTQSSSEEPYGSSGEMGLYEPQIGAEYSAYASSWFASSPWGGCASMSGPGLVEGDFDLGRVPEVELHWGLEPHAFGALNSSAFGGAYPSLSGGELEGESGGYMEKAPYDALFSGEISFDEMMAE